MLNGIMWESGTGAQWRELPKKYPPYQTCLAVSIESASPHESQLVEGVLGHSFLDTLPARLIGDKAYDSDRWTVSWPSTMALR